MEVSEKLVWLAFALFGSQLFAQEQSAQEAAKKLAGLDRAWGQAASTPNTSLEIREASRTGPVIRYRLYTKGLPSGIYTMVSWPVTQRGPSESLRGITFDRAGMAICAGTPGTCGVAENPNDPIDIPINAVPGEPFRFGLISADGATKVFARIIPKPLHGEDGPCSVSATLLTPGAEMVLIEGKGFGPDEEILLDSDSAGEVLRQKVKSTSAGGYNSFILPFKKGLTQGMSKVALKSKTCAPSVSFHWGKGN